jgi:hypothetical protein
VNSMYPTDKEGRKAFCGTLSANGKPRCSTNAQEQCVDVGSAAVAAAAAPATGSGEIADLIGSDSDGEDE